MPWAASSVMVASNDSILMTKSSSGLLAHDAGIVGR
jgi:hypothetical protein